MQVVGLAAQGPDLVLSAVPALAQTPQHEPNEDLHKADAKHVSMHFNAF